MVNITIHQSHRLIDSKPTDSLPMQVLKEIGLLSVWCPFSRCAYGIIHVKSVIPQSQQRDRQQVKPKHTSLYLSHISKSTEFLANQYKVILARSVIGLVSVLLV